MHNSGVCTNLCTGLSDKQRERAPERQREILFVFLFCLYLPAFFTARAQALPAPERVKERERKRVFSISF